VGRPRRPLRVLHTADLHLESDGYGSVAERDRHRARCREAFRRVVDRALGARADLLLIAGDLFDHDRVADGTVAFVRGQLARFPGPVVILPGNHDALYPGGVHDRHDLAEGAGHVRVIRRRDGETVDLPELDAVVWGRAMDEHVPEFSPLAHLPARADGRWCLALGHGFFHGVRRRPERSSPIFADEIRDSGWDYLALGHHHLPTDVSQGGVTARYPGAPVIEWGGTAPDGAVLCVDLAEGHVGVRPLLLYNPLRPA
jgi:DNA repair exonuclease SbcCD nuclease subunit